jgi:hypothetical protein
MLEIGECDCLCHIDEHIMHIMPCCDECPSCEKNFKFGIDQHTEKCKIKIEKE